MVLKKIRSGRCEATTTLFRPFSPMNSGFGREPRLRRCALFFRQEAGSSQRFLWLRPFLQKGRYQMQFYPIPVRLLPSFGKVRANHFACVKEPSFLLRATSFAKSIFLFQHDKFPFQYLGRDSPKEVALTFSTKKKSFPLFLSHKQSKTGRIFRVHFLPFSIILPPSLWAKKLFVFRMITGDPILFLERQIRDT